MCGIIGFNWNDKALLRKASKEISHRGPDHTGTFFDKDVSLGHNRLSIIDLSKAGNQPLSNEDDTIWIVFNGEIYNFKELRKFLEKKHSFKSNTDTEVLIHLYEEKGFNMLNYLQGMFAFCIYDSKKKILFLARDRVGIKPIYYYKKGKNFMFCSEIKGILKNKEVDRKINSDSLSSYLTFRANTQEKTLLEGIKKLMPGHFLIYGLRDKKFKIKKYWDIYRRVEKKPKPYFTRVLRNLLEDSVKSRLMSDVPYGAYLSGGVDSGIIVSLMGKYSSQKVNTFSVGFEEEEHSESKEARFLAEKLGTNHHELIIKNDSIKNLPNVIYNLDEPMSDPTSIPLYLLSKYTKKHSTVILTGEGSDELFAGYPQYKFMKIHKHIIKKMPQYFRHTIPKIVRNTPGKALNKGFKFASSLGEKGVDRFSTFVNSNDGATQYLNQISIFNEKEQEELLNNKVDLYKKYATYFQNKDIINSCQKLDFKEPMVEDLLMKVDKNTMAFSIEGRVPFLDHRIVEFSSKIPSGMKLRGLINDKYILRESVKDLIPKETRKRKKRHFFVPIDSWFKNELSPFKETLLSENFIKKQNIFNYNYIKKIEKGFSKSKLFYSRQLWSLVTFQIWYKKYIENEMVRI